MVDNRSNEQYREGNKLLREQAENVEFIKDAFRSLTAELIASVDAFTEALEGSDEVAQKIAKSTERDIVSSIKQFTKGLEKNVVLQEKINRGINVASEIEKRRVEDSARLEQIKASINLIEGVSKEQKETLVNLAEKQAKFANDALDALEKSNIEEQKKISLTGTLLKNLQSAADKLDKTGTLKALLSGDTSVLTNTRQLEASFLLIGKTLLEADKQIVSLQRQLGISAREAGILKVGLAEAVGIVGINSADTKKALSEINTELGIASTSLRGDVVGEMARLGKFTGMSAESQANFALQAQISGQNARELTLETRRGVLEAEKERGVRLDINKILDEAGKVTGIIRANLGFNVQNISKAIGVAKQFGMTLQDLVGISSNLLDFQSSISAELEAELFTGKTLRLERARLFALTGNYEGLTREINKNVGSELEFARMNVIEKEKLASALGMNADQLSDIVFREKGFLKLAQEARDVGDEELANMLERRSLQQQFTDITMQLKQVFVDLMTPLLPLLESFSNLIQNSKAFKDTLKMIAGVSLGALAGNIARIAAATIIGAGAKTAGLIGAIAGLAVAYKAISAINEAGASVNVKDAQIEGANEFRIKTLPQDSIHIDKTGAATIGTNLQGNNKNLEEKLDILIAVSRQNRVLTTNKFTQRSIYDTGKTESTLFS